MLSLETWRGNVPMEDELIGDGIMLTADEAACDGQGTKFVTMA
jgi:hypothetical protein